MINIHTERDIVRKQMLMGANDNFIHVRLLFGNK